MRGEKIRLFLLWLTGASSSVVFIEPSLYELSTAAAIGLFAISGLSFQAALMPFAALLILTNIGYTISSSHLLGDSKVLTWVITSWYLAATALFFAAILSTNTERRLNALMRGVIIAAIITSLVGIAGYFRLIPGAGDLLLLYDRARSTFKDPNVFGAYLVLPALLATQMMLTGSLAKGVRGLMLLGLFMAGLLLSFSRGAWGQVAFAGAVMLALNLVTTRSPNQRLRIVLLTIGGAAGLALLLAGLMSMDTVANILKQRLSLEQSYDVGETGRFARHAMGALLAFDEPLGIGPLQFTKYFPEDPHNSYLNAFMAGGWLAGVSFATMVALSLAFGLRAVFVRTPWQPMLIVVFSAYLGTMAESVIIDSDHWRHAFMLLGLLWGLIAATRRYESERARGTAP